MLVTNIVDICTLQKNAELWLNSDGITNVMRQMDHVGWQIRGFVKDLTSKVHRQLNCWGKHRGEGMWRLFEVKRSSVPRSYSRRVKNFCNYAGTICTIPFGWTRRKQSIDTPIHVVTSIRNYGQVELGIWSFNVFPIELIKSVAYLREEITHSE